MKSLIDTERLSRSDLDAIWRLVSATEPLRELGPVACSFQGTGTRTRTTFLRATYELGLRYIELPPFLETEERVQDLAGYLDPLYALYVIRFRDHRKLEAFAEASERPVINAMSAVEHPCEAIADAFWFLSEVKPLEGARIALWGQTTNVLRSWRNVAAAAGAAVSQVQDEAEPLPEAVDLVVTDGWAPGSGADQNISLQLAHLERMGNPLLLPTPPFAIGKELAFDPVTYSGFVGYKQKTCLLPVQKAIIRYAVQGSAEMPAARGGS
jgi:hypothetical protein